MPDRKNEIELLLIAHKDNPSSQTISQRLIIALKTALEASESERLTLERDIKKLEHFLSGKSPITDQ
jgi:hypothetical protein